MKERHGDRGAVSDDAHGGADLVQRRHAGRQQNRTILLRRECQSRMVGKLARCDLNRPHSKADKFSQQSALEGSAEKLDVMFAALVRKFAESLNIKLKRFEEFALTVFSGVALLVRRG